MTADTKRYAVRPKDVDPECWPEVLVYDTLQEAERVAKWLRENSTTEWQSVLVLDEEEETEELMRRLYRHDPDKYPDPDTDPDIVAARRAARGDPS